VSGPILPAKSRKGLNFTELLLGVNWVKFVASYFKKAERFMLRVDCKPDNGRLRMAAISK
jgi:hypothetical protein